MRGAEITGPILGNATQVLGESAHPARSAGGLKYSGPCRDPALRSHALAHPSNISDAGFTGSKCEPKSGGEPDKEDHGTWPFPQPPRGFAKEEAPETSLQA